MGLYFCPNLLKMVTLNGCILLYVNYTLIKCTLEVSEIRMIFNLLVGIQITSNCKGEIKIFLDMKELMYLHGIFTFSSEGPRGYISANRRKPKKRETGRKRKPRNDTDQQD